MLEAEDRAGAGGVDLGAELGGCGAAAVSMELLDHVRSPCCRLFWVVASQSATVHIADPSVAGREA